MPRTTFSSKASEPFMGRSGRSAYPTSGTAARARSDYGTSRNRDRSQPHLDVTLGAREQTAHDGNVALIAGVAIAMVLLTITLVCFARIALVNATVTVDRSSQTLSTELSDSRSEATALEVEDTVLSNTSRIKAEATELEMAAPESVDTIQLNDDVVATNADGSLSFGESVKRATTASTEE